tara:strand:- start:90 stop:398 length:309 start_codon:yes stop_codon:yes gene_type:complete
MCFYCFTKCAGRYFSFGHIDSDDEEPTELPEYRPNTLTISTELPTPSPRTIRVIEKYGHFKPDYSSDSEYTLSSNYSTESEYDSEYDSENDSEQMEIPVAYG